jgi:hypothetical protein
MNLCPDLLHFRQLVTMSGQTDFNIGIQSSLAGGGMALLVFFISNAHGQAVILITNLPASDLNTAGTATAKLTVAINAHALALGGLQDGLLRFYPELLAGFLDVDTMGHDPSS